MLENYEVISTINQQSSRLILTNEKKNKKILYLKIII